MVAGIQNELSRVCFDERTLKKITEAQRRQQSKEKSGTHKWVRITKNDTKLRLLCRIDADGNLLPQELQRIEKTKKALGIKE